MNAPPCSEDRLERLTSRRAIGSECAAGFASGFDCPDAASRAGTKTQAASQLNRGSWIRDFGARWPRGSDVRFERIFLIAREDLHLVLAEVVVAQTFEEFANLFIRGRTLRHVCCLF